MDLSALVKGLLLRAEIILCAPGDDEETRHRKVQFVAASVLVIPTGVIWGALYWANGEQSAAVIPVIYSIVTVVNLAVLGRAQQYEVFRFTQMVMIMVLPTALMVALGGYVGGSGVIVWSFLAVLMGLLFGTAREARWWLAAYVAMVILAAVIEPSVEVQNNLPDGLVLALFVLNVVTVSTVAFVVLFTFVTDRRRLRDLEVAYLNQELMLRQTEKLATLGTLAAGVTHELNNPAASTQRAAQQLREAHSRLHEAEQQLSAAGLSDAQWGEVKALEVAAREAAGRPRTLDAMARADSEVDVEGWLARHNIGDGWELAPSLVAQGLDTARLDRLEAAVASSALGPVVAWAARVFPVHALIYEIAEGSARISEIVVALKSYVYLGQAPLVAVDIHEGLDNTLVILRGKLRDGISVHREYCTNMPKVPAYGSELNQVWTNLLDNAIAAMDGPGNIIIRTRHENGWAVVEIEDDGPGIPAEVQARVFDPFFTTKAPGQGTGLGLSTSHAIVVDKHKGSLRVESRPGQTRFIVSLPQDPTSEGTQAT